MMQKQLKSTKGRKREGTKARKRYKETTSRFRAFALLCFSISLTVLPSCTGQSPVPKPYGYFNISLPAHEYHEIATFSEFAFSASVASVLQPVSDSIAGKWFNLVYPKFNAVIYCCYLPVTLQNFRKVAEDSYQFVYRHAIKADAIHQAVYDNEEAAVHAILYELKGNAATPLQFIVTDSVRHFFRGSLYFNQAPNQDSIAPVLAYLKEDIVTMISGFYWK
jgi:gliding motility-associated lipoprotein GldD